MAAVDPSPAPRRSRRSGPRPAGDVSTAVLEAAERLLAETSLEDLTVADVIAAAGVSRASFYFYFESKHAVLAALLGRVIGELHAAADPWFEGTSRHPDALREGLAGSVAVWRRHGPVLRAGAEAWRSDPEVGRLWAGFVEEFVRAAAKRIDADRRAGLAPAGGPDPEALAAALVWMNERCFYVASIEAEPALAGDERLVEALHTAWHRAIYVT